MRPILQTKLRVPPLREILIPRPQLQERLDALWQRPFALISAPAGFGKTTLVTEWVHHHLAATDSCFAWYSLDASDNDLIRFLRHLCTALQTAVPDLPDDLIDLLHEHVVIDDLLTDLLNGLMASAKPIVLVLDDYHLIQDEEIHQAITFWLNHVTTQCPSNHHHARRSPLAHRPPARTTANH